ncbi:hypothetical protein FA13DRAFT_1792985 [Coprinellus micaceus]|uniref:Uncharacterized protein n=1 Tax=Coprinellus micaceus TaxID=71717 RepID=A0A4Y7T6C4_COPMI|nr:hypothetical protein FA13DRAFT_1792985 [Coprinellus micaceus]
MYEEQSNLLRRLKVGPERWVEHIQLFFGTNIVRATYGFEDIGKNASLIHDAEQLIQRLGVVNTPWAVECPGWATR